MHFRAQSAARQYTTDIKRLNVTPAKNGYTLNATSLMIRAINTTFDLNVNDDEDNDNDNEIETTLNCKYYTIEDFENAKFNSEKTFSIFHLNIHSVERHISELRIILQMLNFHLDFICLTESKIQKDAEPKVDININGYQTPFGTPTESSKGGVLIYAKTGINFKPRNDLNIYKTKELESAFIEVINPKRTNSIIGVIYRHPCMETNIFNDEYLKNLAEKLSSENKNNYISGDFNYDLLKVSTHNETFDFFNIMMSNFLQPLINIPTKINSTNDTIIDNIFTNDLNPDTKSGNLSISISDHLPSFMIVPKQNQTHLPKKHNIYTRSMKKFNRENFILDYLSINWNETLEINIHDINHSINRFMTKINELIDKHMPLTKVSQKEFIKKYKPWLTNELLSKITNKNKLFKKFIKCKNEDRKTQLHEEYKVIKNEITFLTRQSKQTYYEEYFIKHKKNLKKTWQGIKEIINIKSKNYDHPSCIIHEDRSITDPVEMANKFNDFYVSIADNILKERKYNGNKHFSDYLRNPLTNSIVFYPCDELEVKSIIKSFHPKKASGPNSIPTEILHMMADDICNPLNQISNLSLSTGQHPDILKISKTIPIYKKGSRLLVSNYRPISLLSNINKII